MGEEAQRKEEEREAEARRKTLEQEARREADEAEALRKNAEVESRKELFQTDTLLRRQVPKRADESAKIAGGYRERQHVMAAQDITIRGNLVVLARTAGIVLGPAETDPIGRIAVEFVKRQDGGVACLNVVPKEIMKG